MFHFYNFNRDDFLDHYHKRSNVESTFSMIKAKFGDSLSIEDGRRDGQRIARKILCHNLCCLIQSHFELGIEATFWGKQAAEPAMEEVAETDDWIEAMAWI